MTSALDLPLLKPPVELSTERLLLRPLRVGDRPAFHAMNADPRVMEHFVAPLSTEESEAMAERTELHMRERGYGVWALEARGVMPFAGLVGLSVPTFEAPFVPCVEIGWRLCFDAWGHGWAREAAAAVLLFGHQTLGLREILSFTATSNTRSMRLMERIGMQRDPARDFLHPRVPVGHRLRPHVVYASRSSNAA
jgi:RimJ/RimL family protein N-acetyltransferase